MGPAIIGRGDFDKYAAIKFNDKDLTVSRAAAYIHADKENNYFIQNNSGVNPCTFRVISI